MSNASLFRPDHSGLLSLFAPIYAGAGQALVTDHQQPLFSEPRSDKESFYFRDGLNPTVNHVENKLRRLYNVPTLRLVQSGMSAISVAILTVFSAKARVFVSSDCFVDTQLIALQHLSRFGIAASVFDLTEDGDLPAEFILKENDIIVVETVSNPLCRHSKVQSLREKCQHVGAYLIIDNTLPTSLALPVAPDFNTLIVESLTKYHLMNTGWAGAVICSDEHQKAVHEVIKLFGFALNAETASKLEIGLHTLHLRLQTQIKNRNVFLKEMIHLTDTFNFEVLNDHEEAVYPFLVFRFSSAATATLILDGFSQILPSPSFGGPQYMASLGNFHVTAETDQLLSVRGVDGGILRLCIGLEAPAAALADFTSSVARFEEKRPNFSQELK